MMNPQLINCDLAENSDCLHCATNRKAAASLIFSYDTGIDRYGTRQFMKCQSNTSLVLAVTAQLTQNPIEAEHLLIRAFLQMKCDVQGKSEN